MDMFHVDIILLIILCFLTVFMCAYGTYCVYRLLVSLQMQILLRPTRVLFSHKKEGQARAELRTVVAYQNPFTGDYCVNKSRDGPRGYINTTPSPDSGLSDEYEPLHQPALAHSSAKPDHQGFEPLHRRDYGQYVDSAFTSNIDPSYQQRHDPIMSYIENNYHEPSQLENIYKGSRSTRRQLDPGMTVTTDPSDRRGKKLVTMLDTNRGRTGVRFTSTRSLDTQQPSKSGWITHLKSALRKPHHHLKTTSMPSVEDNVLDRTWNWNYKEYQI